MSAPFALFKTIDSPRGSRKSNYKYDEDKSSVAFASVVSFFVQERDWHKNVFDSPANK